VAFFPPFADHFLVADMAVPLDFFAIISPPGIEQPLISYGRLRAGENAAPCVFRAQREWPTKHEGQGSC